MPKEITFPQYRKYANGQSFFKIISAQEFEEIKVTGQTKEIHNFIAKILPDRNYIHDLTFDYTKYWVSCSEEEYNTTRETATKAK